MWYIGNGEVELAECSEGTQNALPVDSYVEMLFSFRLDLLIVFSVLDCFLYCFGSMY